MNDNDNPQPNPDANHPEIEIAESAPELEVVEMDDASLLTDVNFGF